MLRLSAIAVGVLGIGVLSCVAGVKGADAAEDHAFFHENVLGTSCELRVQADSEEAARWAEARALGVIDRLAAIFSGYDRTSEFSRWQETMQVPVQVSAELFEMLRASDDWGARSAGAFDPRVEALSRLWSTCARQDRLPTAEETAEARSLMGRPAWRLDPESRTATHLTRCPLSLNAIAKGYIVERACDAVMEESGRRGIRGMLLNIGGDLRVCGEPGRAIGIAAPRGDSESTEPFASIEVRGMSVATSGNAQRGFDIRRRHYSHIFDPRSGAPVDRIIAATVIAPRGADADALATLCNVLPFEESLRLVDAMPDVACMLVGDDGRIARSARWDRHEKPHSPLLALADAQGGDVAKETPSAPLPAGNDEFELRIGFEINRPDGDSRRTRRPYVAIWVEDKDGLPIRTLTLWVQAGGQGPRWIPDLKRWYREDQVRKLVDDTNLVETIARATRLPGKYEVLWDGRDDHGKPLGPGEYTVSIEAAREHGTYQIIRKSVTLANRPFVEELKGNVEIKSATVDYRRKGTPR